MKHAQMQIEVTIDFVHESREARRHRRERRLRDHGRNERRPEWRRLRYRRTLLRPVDFVVDLAVDIDADQADPGQQVDQLVLPLDDAFYGLANGPGDAR